jgi:hypothetical protein
MRVDLFVQVLQGRKLAVKFFRHGGDPFLEGWVCVAVDGADGDQQDQGPKAAQPKKA